MKRWPIFSGFCCKSIKINSSNVSQSWYNNNKGNIMAKTETVHARVTYDIKKQADEIFSRLGLTTSQAIMLFLTASVNKNGMPFELTLSNNEEQDLEFANSIATVDGVAPSKQAQKIMKLYSRGDIDYETAEFAIKRIYNK